MARLAFFSLLALVAVTVSLVTVSANAQTIAFDQKTLDFNGNGSISGGTSLQFGPDGLLYVSQVNGLVKVFDITRDEATGDYLVNSSETISLVQSIPNHNDDGTAAAGTTTRQVTGITVGGTAGAVEVYVTSSDSRVGAGGGGGDVNLDTNSGVITRLTRNGTGGWTAVDLVRGLPRSEENHATNGLELVTIGTDRYLIVASGGFTNAGAPSNNFAYISEYALAGAVLAVNLTMLESMPVQTDTDSGRSYVYDLPTLDDPTRANVNGITDPDDSGYDGIDVNDPFGGNDGLNQAKLVEGGPVQMFSPGYRNTYDLVVTESGAVYVTDNGANGGWGGYPENEATGTSTSASTVTNAYRPGEPGSSSFDTANGEPQVNNEDQLNLVTTDIQTYAFGSVYGGHPAPVRANVNAGLYTRGAHTDDTGDTDGDGFDDGLLRTVPYDPDGTGDAANPNRALPANWPPVPPTLINVDNDDFRMPGENNPDSADPAFAPFEDPKDDITVTNWQNNTNAIAEYTASNFAGAMQGDLIAGRSGGNLHRVQLQPDSTLLSLDQSFAANLGGNPLGITTQGDSNIFPGTIWVANFFGNAIVILEPNDFVECILPGEPGYDPSADNDFDGFTNQDELDNGTDLCSGSSQPGDIDDDKISNLNDLDDDGDGIDDASDPFQLGLPFNLPVANELFSDNPELGGYLGLGVTGLMNNGAPNPNWLDWLDRTDQGTGPNDVLGGAIGAMTVQQTGGTAAGTANTQEKAYQYGVNVSTATGPFVVEGGMFGFNEPGQLYDFVVNTGDGEPSQGIFLGTGFQDNYIELVLTQDGITFREEVADVTMEQFSVTLGIDDRPQGGDGTVAFSLVVDPVAGTVQGQYSIDGGPLVSAGTISAEGEVLAAIQNAGTPLAVGLIGTSGAPEDLAEPNDDREFGATWDYLRVTGSAPSIANPLPDLERFIDDPAEDINLDNFFGDDNGTAGLVYTVQSNTDPAVGAVVSGNVLTLSYPPAPTSADITVRATDADSFFVEQTFTVSVTDEPEPVIRVNAGGTLIPADDGGPDWLANTATGSTSGAYPAGASYSVNAGSISTQNISCTTGSGRHPSIPDYITDAVCAGIGTNERWDPAAAPEMLWSFPLPAGDYVVRLYMGNGFSGTSAAGQRVFDVTIEGALVLDDQDLSATYGHQTLVVEEFPVSLTDGTLDIEFLHVVENPLINGIEIMSSGTLAFPITVDPIGNQASFESASVNVAVAANGGDGALNYAATGLPPGLAMDAVSGVISGIVDSGAAAGSPYDVTVTVDDADADSADAKEVSFTWTVTAAPEPGDVLFRVNAGGPLLPDAAGDWGEDQSVANAAGTAATGTPSPYLDLSGASLDTTFGADFLGTNATGAPDSLFTTERFSEVAGTDDNLQYDFPVPSGDYIVKLYFAEVWTGAENVGDRVFDVFIEGALVLDDHDQVAQYGWNNAAVESFPITVTDDNIDVDFVQIVQNPAIKGIEILQAGPGASPDAAAAVSIDPGGDIDASTFGGGFVIANDSNNGLQIASVTFDLSTAIFPNMVFDPLGTAGDPTAQCFLAVSGATDTGLLTDGSGSGDGSCADPFSVPRGTGGYDVLTIEFSDFDPGETFEFAADVDPTSINADEVGGKVAGLELIGSTITVTFADGTTTLVTEPYRVQPDSVTGSGNTILPTPVAPAPGLTIGGATLEPAGVPGVQNATINTLSPTVTLSGPAGSNVTLLVVNGEETVPIADPFEMNRALAATEYDAVIGAGGTVDVPVTLTDAGDSELNYLAAVIVQPDGRTTNLSTIWRVNYVEPPATGVLYRVNAGGPQVAAADASLPDWEADTDAAPSQYRVAGGGNTFAADNADAHAGAINMTSPTLTPGAPVDIFEIERWDPPAAPEMAWQFPVDAGTEVTVRLYVAELFSGITAAEQRVFDVAVEGVVPPAFDDIDTYALAGPKGAYMLSASTTVSGDGMLDLEFIHVVENPAIKGIEIIAGAETNPQALIQVTPGGALAASTFGAGSFSIDNLGDTPITSVIFDTRTGYLPDVVFDPIGTAGDAGAKCLTADSGAAETGFVAPTDACVDLFSEPHNGVDGDDGYDVLTLDFTGFEPGEAFTFSVDMDPTSIKTDTTSGDAGAISGFELIGSAVTIGFEDGTVLTTSLFDESSLGGSIVDAQKNAPDAPVLALVGGSAPIAVADTAQTILVTGTPGTAVELLQVDARLYIDAGGGGYDIDPFEANDAMAKVIYNATIEGDGDVEVPVTLLATATSDAGPDGGINHFIAVQNEGGIRSATSNVLVVEYDPTITATGTLEGTLLLQGRSDNTATDLTVTLYDLAGVQVGTPVNVASDSTGLFTVTDIAEGTYQVAVKDPQYLQVVETVTVVAGTNSVDFGEAPAGDANGDNLVSLLDFSVLASTFNLASGDAGYDGRADFNGDGLVSLLDFSLLATNFNTAGEVPAAGTP